MMLPVKFQNILIHNIHNITRVVQESNAESVRRAALDDPDSKCFTLPYFIGMIHESATTGFEKITGRNMTHDEIGEMDKLVKDNIQDLKNCLEKLDLL